MSLVCRTAVVAFVFVAMLSTCALADEPTAAPANAAASNATVGVGSPFPALSLRDQHGEPFPIAAGTRTVLFTRDMDAGAFVKEALGETGRETLAAAKAVVLSDVSPMPTFVLRTFALPSLRKRSYPMGLDETGEATKSLPSQKGKVSVLSLENGRVSAVEFAVSTEEVKAAVSKRE